MDYPMSWERVDDIMHEYFEWRDAHRDQTAHTKTENGYSGERRFPEPDEALFGTNGLVQLRLWGLRSPSTTG